MKHLKRLEEEVSRWPQISVHPHRFGGREFRFQSAEVGYVHTGGIVDIPFPRSIRDALLAEGLAEEHRWVPNSGWVTFRIRIEDDLKHALWLLRPSYLRYTLKTAKDPRKLLQQEGEELRLSPQFRSLLEKFVPRAANQVSTEPLPAQMPRLTNSPSRHHDSKGVVAISCKTRMHHLNATVRKL